MNCLTILKGLEKFFLQIILKKILNMNEYYTQNTMKMMNQNRKRNEGKENDYITMCLRNRSHTALITQAISG
jgi:hypothetical protein